MLPPRERLKCELNLNAVWAEEVLRTTPRLTPESIRKLTLTATGSQNRADDAYSEALADEMRRKG